MKECRETKDYSQLFKSDRGIYLISNTPGTITVEDNNKFDEFYFINNNGNVENITNKVDFAIENNNYNPADIVKFAIENDMKIEYLSYTAICQIYIQDSGRFNIPEEHLPTYEDLKKVLMDGNDITEEMNYCETFGLYPEHFNKETCIKSYSKKTKEICKFNYAKCTSSYNGFIEGEIYRVTNPISQESGECFYILQEDPKTGICNLDYSKEIFTEDVDHFVFILNTDISTVPVIKKIFDLLQD